MQVLNYTRVQSLIGNKLETVNYYDIINVNLLFRLKCTSILIIINSLRLCEVIIGDDINAVIDKARNKADVNRPRRPDVTHAVYSDIRNDISVGTDNYNWRLPVARCA